MRGGGGPDPPDPPPGSATDLGVSQQIFQTTDKFTYKLKRGSTWLYAL